MKKMVFTAVLLAVLGTLAVSCLKENPVEPSGVGVQDETVYNVCYSVDGVTMRDTLYGQAEWSTFLHRLVALAKEGHEVSFRDGNAAGSVVAPKETVTFVSKNEEEVVRWSTTMFDDGYEVTIVYNEETDEFTCIAVRDTLAPQPSQLSAEMFVGLWEQSSGCTCSKGFDLCFYPDGKMCISQCCDSNFFYSVEGDTLWLQGERPAVVQFDTLIDGTVTMTMHTKLPLCREPGEGNNGWFDYTYVKRNGFIHIVNTISPSDLQGIWTQEEQCECITYDTLYFSSTNLVYNIESLTPGKYCVLGNTLYEMQPSGAVMEHPVKMAVWPDGKKLLRIEEINNPCNLNNTLESLSYYLVQ